MKKTIMVLTVLSLVVVGLIGTGAIASAAPPDRGEVYVTSLDETFYTFVTPDTLHYNGHNAKSFQELTDEGAIYGPGVPGHHGGRWWVDANGNGQIDMGEEAVHCPLVGKVK
jgi:hypothetical protein